MRRVQCGRNGSFCINHVWFGIEIEFIGKPFVRCFHVDQFKFHFRFPQLLANEQCRGRLLVERNEHFLCIDVTAGAKKCKILMELEIPRLIKTPEQAPGGCMLDTGDSK